jgi:hypothetical protein
MIRGKRVLTDCQATRSRLSPAWRLRSQRHQPRPVRLPSCLCLISGWHGRTVLLLPIILVRLLLVVEAAHERLWSVILLGRELGSPTLPSCVLLLARHALPPSERPTHTSPAVLDCVSRDCGGCDPTAVDEADDGDEGGAGAGREVERVERWRSPTELGDVEEGQAEYRWGGGCART